jgi:hypothetical protein
MQISFTISSPTLTSPLSQLLIMPSSTAKTMKLKKKLLINFSRTYKEILVIHSEDGDNLTRLKNSEKE